MLSMLFYKYTSLNKSKYHIKTFFSSYICHKRLIHESFNINANDRNSLVLLHICKYTSLQI